MFKKLLGIVIALTGVLCMFGCNSNNNNNENEESNMPYQLRSPKKGEEVAVIKTSKGEIKVKLFPEEAPKAVENFKTHASAGYYNNQIFHRVIKDFMIQGGDPTGTGRGGESIYGKPFEDEFSEKLVNISGALAMANAGKNTNQSQFFINYMDKEQFNGWETYQKIYDQYTKNPDIMSKYYKSIFDMSKLSEETKQLYVDHGGNPHLDGAYNVNGTGHTVFGQVYEGLDVVKNISLVETDDMDAPKEKVVIEEIRIEKA